MDNFDIFKNKTLLITGGTGSFGNAVAKRFLDTDINEIRILSRDEKKQDDMRKKYKNNKLSMGHAVSLLSLKSKTQMLAIANRIIKNKLSVRNTEEIISKINSNTPKSKSNRKSLKSQLLNEFESKLIHKFGTKVSISSNNKGKGKVVFEFYTQDDLERILDLLNK